MKKLDKVINECIEVEVSEGLHTDSIDNYDSPVDFYLSNIVGTKKEEYIEHLKEYYVLNQKDAEYVYNEIIRIIKGNYNK